MTPRAGRVAIAGGVLTLAMGFLTACGPDPAGSGWLVGRLTGTSDVANLPGGDPIGGGGLAVLPIIVMDGLFWELTGAEPLADPPAGAGLIVPLSESDVSELGGMVTPIADDGEFRITAQPGEYAICYWSVKSGGRVSGCSDLELPREGELAAFWGEGGFHIGFKE
jgi:hypothetical protein